MAAKKIVIACSACGAAWHGLTACGTQVVQVNRNESLNHWLSQNDATPLTDCAGPNGSVLTWYSIKGHTIIVQRYYGGDGWEIYMPTTTSNEIQAAFDAVAAKIAEFEGRGTQKG